MLTETISLHRKSFDEILHVVGNLCLIKKKFEIIFARLIRIEQNRIPASNVNHG